MSNEEAEVVESGPGALLKEVREQQGLSVKEVADKLKLMEQSVLNIEADNYKDIPITFYKGYLKNYAHLLGLNSEKTHETFCNYLESQGVDSGCRLTPAYKDERIIKKTNRQLSNFFKKLISFLIVLAIVYSIYYLLIEKNYWNKFINSFNKTETTQEQLLDSDQNEGELIPNTEITQNSFSQTSSDANAMDLPLNENTEAVDSEPEVASEASPISTSSLGNSTSADNRFQSNNHQLVLSFSGDCWIEVVDATGRVLISGIKTAGHISQVSGQMPYQLTIGKVPNVSIEFQGDAVDLSSYSDTRIAKFTLGG